MKSIYKFLAPLALIYFSIINPANATHIRAGQITAEVVSCQNLEYRFTITGYTDTGSDVQFGGGTISFGDGTVVELNPDDVDEKIELEDQVAINLIFIPTPFRDQELILYVISNPTGTQTLSIWTILLTLLFTLKPKLL
jgi:hypothetical protein